MDILKEWKINGQIFLYTRKYTYIYLKPLNILLITNNLVHSPIDATPGCPYA